MQTFRISNTQRQNYYAIRIFGIVHLIGAIGLVVLLDGPSNGLRLVSWILIAVLLASCACLLLRVIQARAGRINGHYVLTRKTLAIMLPGQPRSFIRKRDCTGFLPGRSALVFRNGSTHSLRSLSSNPYRRDLVDGLCRAWWPGLYGTSLWKGLMEGDPEGTLDLRVDFRGKPDGRDPILIYTTGRSRGIWQYRGLAAYPLLVAGFVLLLFQNWEEISSENFSEVAMVWQVLTVISSAVGVVASLAAMAYIARQVFFRESSNNTFVISGRTMAVLQAGERAVFLHSGDLEYFNPLLGQLYFRSLFSVIAAPYRYGAPYNGLLRILFSCWRPGVPVQTFAAGSGTINGNLAFWLCASTWIGWTSLLPWIMLVFFWLDFKKQASERIDVSPSTIGSPAIPPTANLRIQR